MVEELVQYILFCSHCLVLQVSFRYRPQKQGSSWKNYCWKNLTRHHVRFRGLVPHSWPLPLLKIPAQIRPKYHLRHKIIKLHFPQTNIFRWSSNTINQSIQTNIHWKLISQQKRHKLFQSGFKITILDSLQVVLDQTRFIQSFNCTKNQIMKKIKRYLLTTNQMIFI